MKFKEMNLSKGTLKALEEMKLDETFPIQELTIKPIMEGKDLMGKAESGSGKTLAFAIPIVEKIYILRIFKHSLLHQRENLPSKSAGNLRK